ncbi:hypothetical protein KFK09_004632 [Dendrobium nobile]|uniref:Uncharacterized protein n=1 Tax=Dendrobium nobile TaxID=94219 RepID=A0A8T3C170_DENNO|nr:hypothetical protein KFK09_004632 [Dendrobium nobile]
MRLRQKNSLPEEMHQREIRVFSVGDGLGSSRKTREVGTKGRTRLRALLGPLRGEHYQLGALPFRKLRILQLPLLRPSTSTCLIQSCVKLTRCLADLKLATDEAIAAMVDSNDIDGISVQLLHE